MRKKDYYITRELLFDFDCSLSYQDFVDMELYKAIDITKSKVTLSNKDGKELNDEFLVDYNAYKTLFDLNYKKENKSEISYGLRDFLVYILLKNFVGFGLEISKLRDIKRVLTAISKEKFYAKDIDGEVLLGIVSNMSDEYMKFGCFDFIKYKNLKDKRDKTGLKGTYDLFRKTELKSRLDRMSQVIKFKYESENCYNIEYMVFCVLVLDLDLYLALGQGGRVSVVRKKDLYERLESDQYLMTEISIGIKGLFDKIMGVGLIDKIRDKYDLKKDKSIEKCLGEVQKQFNLIGNVEIDVESKETDLSKYLELDDKFDSAEIGIKKHKGVKKHIKVKNKYKLKK